jgi:hypothetical protein
MNAGIREQSEANYSLNCGTRASIRAGETNTFDMRFDMPSTMLPVSATLRWVLNNSGQFAELPVDIR